MLTFYYGILETMRLKIYFSLLDKTVIKEDTGEM